MNTTAAAAAAPTVAPTVCGAVGELEGGLNEDQLRALRLVQARRNVFVTGAGGAGKSHLLHTMKRWAHQKKLVFAVTATTGIAAINVGGITIHSFGGILKGDDTVEELVAKIRSSRAHNKRGSAYDRWCKTQLLFVDEISMLSSELFHKLDQIGRALRYRHNVPFGGIQIVLFGDFCQLPPVDKEFQSLMYASAKAAATRPICHINHRHEKDPDEEDKSGPTKRARLGGPASVSAGPLTEQEIMERKYLFMSKAWTKCVHATVLLRKVYRQQDDTFLSLLGRARYGTLTPADKALLRTRLLKDPNCRIKNKSGISVPVLYPRKIDVEQENLQCLRELSGAFLRTNRRTHYVTVRNPPTISLAPNAEQGVAMPAIVVEEPISKADRDAQRIAQKMGETITAAETFVFKVGAAVMLLVNLDVKNKLVNGLCGIVVALGPNAPAPAPNLPLATKDEKKDQKMADKEDVDDAGEHRVLEPDEEKIWVKFECIPEPVPIARYRWKHCLRDNERNLPEEKWTEWIQISQIPLMLAYSSTIHKTQSLTLDAACMSLEGVKTGGQSYTALSRVRRLEGVYFISIADNAFHIDPVIKYFYDLLENSPPPTKQ